MREQWLEVRALFVPYADELRVALSIISLLLLAAAVRYLAWRLMRRFFARIAARAPSVEEKRRVETVGKIVRQSASMLIIVIAAMLVLNQVGVSIAPILGAAGVVGIAIGFGAQSLVKDVFAGFFLLIENQIRVGDVVEIAGKSGAVEELSLRRTKLRAYDGSVHYISNGLITTVTNMSTEFAYAVVDMQIGYREDIDRVYRLMRETAEELRQSPEFSAKLLGELDIAGVEALAESAVVIRARVKTPPLDQWSVRREYLKRLKATFDREGVSIPFPTRTLMVDGARCVVANAPIDAAAASAIGSAATP